ncbi:hypothetical protein IRP61_11095 (plasmid) [Clostridium botulinum]|nr:hypothetical protein [Clostridium botulinum]QPW56419.1 hypothetical protein IRP61_11095 [Clostridium botulinum]
MYQLMIIDKEKVIGVVTNSQRVVNVEEVYPNKNYIGIEVDYNEKLINDFSNYKYIDGKFIPQQPIAKIEPLKLKEELQVEEIEKLKNELKGMQQAMAELSAMATVVVKPK